MTRRAELEVTLGRSGGRRRSPAGKPYRALVLAGFSGAADTGTLEPHRISADEFDSVLERLAPAVALERSAAPLPLTSIDDFHPDALFRRIAALREPPQSPASAPPSQPPQPAAEREDAAQLLQRVLGRSPSTAPSRAQQKVQALIADALAGSAGTTASPASGERGFAAARTAMLRSILGSADFRSVERAWRSVHWLVSRLDEDRLELHIADLPKAALAAQFAQCDGRLEETALHALLTRDANEPWDAVVTDYSFALGTEDLMLLATLGALAARMPAPVLAHAELSLCGCGSPAAVETPWEWKIADDDLGRLWRETRRHPAAKQLVLAAPRFVLRHPYGKRTDPIDSFEFEELPPRPGRDAFLWASPAFACAHWLAQSHAGGDETSIDDLPAPLFGDGTGDAIQPPLEVLLGERARAAAARHGIVTLVGGRNTNRVAADRVFAWADERQENA